MITIGENAFYQCYDLKTVTLPEGLTAIAADKTAKIFVWNSKMQPITSSAELGLYVKAQQRLP